jgi:hypothetical protein
MIEKEGAGSSTIVNEVLTERRRASTIYKICHRDVGASGNKC